MYLFKDYCKQKFKRLNIETIYMVKVKLSKVQRREIQIAFRDYSGDLTKRQKTVLNEYGVDYSITGHNHIQFSYDKRTIVCSGSSSDWRTGRKLATKLIRLLENDFITF